MEQEIMSVKATNGTVIAYEDRVVISRKGLGALVTQGIKGDRTFYYSELSGVEYKKPSFLANGYMKFITSGTNDVDAKVGLFASSLKSGQDANTVILRAFNKETPRISEEVYKFTVQKVREYKNTSKKVGIEFSAADEIAKYKKLLDEGVITPEEFMIKKQKLLGL